MRYVLNTMRGGSPYSMWRVRVLCLPCPWLCRPAVRTTCVTSGFCLCVFVKRSVFERESTGLLQEVCKCVCVCQCARALVAVCLLLTHSGL